MTTIIDLSGRMCIETRPIAEKDKVAIEFSGVFKSVINVILDKNQVMGLLDAIMPVLREVRDEMASQYEEATRLLGGLKHTLKGGG